MIIQTQKKKIIFLANGFPRAGRLHENIFNLNAVKQLLKYYDVKVMVIRTSRLYRRLDKYRIADIEVKYINLPVIPFEHPSIPILFNSIMYKYSTIYALKMFQPKRLDIDNFKDYHLIHSVGGTLTTFIANKIAQHLGIYHITQLIGIDVDFEMPIMCKIPEIRKIYSNISGVVANSHYLAGKYLEYIPETRNIRVIYRGTDIQRFCPSNDADDDSRKQIKGVTFLYLGGFGYNHKGATANMKGGDTLLAAWEKNENELRHLDARLMIGGPNTPNEYIERWRRHLKYPDAVIILGIVDPDDMPKILRSSDAVLIPSLKEGLPNLGMEAAASGKPVIGSNVGGIPELVRDGVDGILVQADNFEAWGIILVKAAASKEQLISYGISARNKAKILFDSSFYGEKLYKFYSFCEYGMEIL